MKVAWVSPLPPAPTGVAEYSARLSRELARHIEIDALESPGARSLASYGACVYQIGNNPLHGAAYDAALAVPGVVVLHDAVLHHLLLGKLSREEYVEEFVFNYGEWLRDFAEQLWRERATSASQESYFRYPLIGRICRRSRGLVVHNRRAGNMARRALGNRNGSVEVVEIPLYVDPPSLPEESERERIREKLGISAEEVVISTFGYLRPSKRLHSLLEASRMLETPGRILLVGDFVSYDYEAAILAEINELPVTRLPYVAESEFWGLVAITDICVNLRYPSAGETSAIALKLMAAGKPVIVTAGEEVSSFPRGSVIQVDSGEAEIEMLAHYLCALAADDEMREVVGQSAARYVAERHNVETVTKQYLDVIRRVVS